MNATQLKWIIGQRGLTPTTRLLLFYYCARANGELVCFPSYGKTADDCELTRRGVIKGTLALCAGGQISILANGERDAILAKAVGKHNPKVNVYRINSPSCAANGEHSSPPHSEHSSPSLPNGEHSSPSYTSLEAKALAMCVPIEPEGGEHSSPLATTDGEQDAPSVVNRMHADGEQDARQVVNTVHPNLEENLKGNFAREAEAPHAAPVVGRSHPAGAPSSARAPEPKDDEGLPKRGTTIGGALGGAPAKAPVLGAGDGSAPTQGLRKPGAPPDPFAEWLDDGAPAARALALAIPRPKPIYATPEAIKAARQALATASAARGGP
jgi:hypothetical protein